MSSTVIDLQNFMERNSKYSSYQKCLRLISHVFQCMRITKTQNVILVLHPCMEPFPLPVELFEKSGFQIKTAENYSDFSEFLTQSSVLVTTDKIFWQLPKQYEDLKLLTLYDNGEYSYITSYTLDFRNGLYDKDDYKLYSSSLKSIRLNFPGVYTKLKYCRSYRLKLYQKTASHRFFQRPLYQTHKLRTLISVPESIPCSIPKNIDWELLHKLLTKCFPTTANHCKRTANYFGIQIR